MYIARKPIPGGYEYSLKESYYEPPYWKSRIILNLGTNPEKYIVYYSDVAFSIELEEILENLGYKVSQIELEKLFFRFLKPEARRIILQFGRSKNLSSTKDKPKLDLKKLHPFDVRRYIVLKFGVTEPEKFVNYPYPFLRNLLNKSRDEIENFFWDMEDRLNYREKQRYLRSIFGIYRIPPKATYKDLDAKFLKVFCEVVEDEKFRMGMDKDSLIKNYFCRYLWLYFDYDYRPPIPSYLYQPSYEQLYFLASYYLEVPVEVIKKASVKEIIKFYRKKAKTLHPDKGGSHEAFIRLKKIIEDLIKIKNLF